MHRGKRYVASLFLSVALLAPMGVFAMAAPQDDHERHEREEQRERERRVYDPYHKDYHNWNQNEDQSYRRWLEERRQGYVDYGRLNRRRQRDYWNWRHSQAEHEEHEHMDQR